MRKTTVMAAGVLAILAQALSSAAIAQVLTDGQVTKIDERGQQDHDQA